MIIPSPCIGTCRIREADQRCDGCERTLDEITRWGSLDSEAKLSVLDAVARRRQRTADRTAAPANRASAVETRVGEGAAGAGSDC